MDDASDSPVYAILGATGGIGTALTRRLAASGARLALAARTEEPLARLAREHGAFMRALDAAKEPESVVDFLKAVTEEYGRLDGAVNLAGSILLKPAHATSPAEFDETLAQNLMSAFALVRAAAPRMRSGGGSIVLVSSAAASVGLANHEAIAAAKGGVEGLARAAAATYARSGVRVNAVAPGLVRTRMSERLLANEALEKTSAALHALGRVGEPDDVAAAIAWLLGPESSWVTGQVLGTDGGLARVRPAGR